MRPNQKICQNPPWPHFLLSPPPLRITLKSLPRRPPSFLPQLPFHHDARLLAETVHKRLASPRSRHQFRIHCSADYQPASHLAFAQRLLCRQILCLVLIPQRHNHVTINRGGHSSSHPRNSRSHFCIPFLPFPI